MMYCDTTRRETILHPVPITIFSLTILVPRVGLPRNRRLKGSLTAPRFSKGGVRKDLNLLMGIGCNPTARRYHAAIMLYCDYAIMLLCYYAIMRLCDYVIMLLCYSYRFQYARSQRPSASTSIS